MPHSSGRATAWPTQGALGIQFRPLFGLRAVELAGLRERWRPSYPLVQELLPLPPTIEAAGPAPVAFSLGPAFQSRLWFLDDRQAELVQLQHDRLTVNWRKSTEDTVYPRYAHLRQVFVDRFGSSPISSTRPIWALSGSRKWRSTTSIRSPSRAGTKDSSSWC